jgi:hypothetical protein
MQVLFISPLSSSFSAKHLLLAVRELTSLFQAIVPHQQAKIIEQIPALAMQFHNDCMYLAHQLLILGIDYGDHLPTVVPLAQRDFTDLVPFLRHVGEHYFNLQLVIASNFARTFNDSLLLRNIKKMNYYENLKNWMDFMKLINPNAMKRSNLPSSTLFIHYANFLMSGK